MNARTLTPIPSSVGTLLTLVLLLLPAAAWSQATGQLSGTATDQSGSVLPARSVN